MAASTEALIAAVAATLPLPSPPPSPLTSYSSPLPQIPPPPLPVSSSLPISPPLLPTSPSDAGAPLGYRATMIRLRAELPSTSHPLPLPLPIVLPHTRASMAMMRAAEPSTYCLEPPSGTPSTYYLAPPSRTPPLLPIPLPTSSPPLLLPSTDCRADVLEVTLPPQKRLCIAPDPRYEIGESSFAPTARPTRGFKADYDFVGTIDAKIRRDLDREIGLRYKVGKSSSAPTARPTRDLRADYELVGTLDDEIRQDPERYRMTDFVTTVEHDTYEIYGRLDDAQDDRLLMSGRLNMLFKDRRAHAHTALLMEREARLSREAWGRSMDASNIARSKTDEYTADTGDSTTGTKMAPKRTTRANPADTTATTSVTNAQLKAMIDQGVTDALAARDADRNTNGDDNHNLGAGVRRTEQVARETVGHDVAYAITWTDLKKKMTDKYCPRGEIKKLEAELWNLKVKGTDVIGYNQRFQELVLLFPEESDKIERYEVNKARGERDTLVVVILEVICIKDLVALHFGEAFV
ncbi:reverse transcriptase domain-containing protein [Tanacetum coccineum]